MSRPVYLDVGGLPNHAFGSRDLMWWGTVSFMVIEGGMFAMLIGAYAYLRGAEAAWPPPGFAVPELLWGTASTLLLLASTWPSGRAARAAEALDITGTRVWLIVADLFALGFLGLRVLEFGALGVRWDSNAYGSIVWTLIGFHTLHLLTDAIETLVLTVMMFTDPGERRLVDVGEDRLYWWFVVFAWLPIYLVLYWVPRWT